MAIHIKSEDGRVTHSYFPDQNGSYNSLYIDLNGNPVEKTKDRYPYSYDMYIMMGQPNIEPTTGSCYSDRLMQWDFDKHDKCLEEVFGNKGQYWNNRKKEDIEKFLQLYFDKKDLKLIRVSEGCNVSNGYPYWFFEYNYSK
jgi:hypothetical protein